MAGQISFYPGFWDSLDNGSFCRLTAGGFSNRLCSKFRYVFLMKVVGLCLNFLLVKFQIIWTFLDQLIVIYVTTVHLIIFIQVSLPITDLT